MPRVFIGADYECAAECHSVSPERWNGWAHPYFTGAQFADVIAMLRAADIIDADGRYHDTDGTVWDDVEITYTPTEKLFALAGWTWLTEADLRAE